MAARSTGDLDGDDVLRRLMDDLLEHGDADQALRRLVQQGFRDGAGRDVAGLRELLDRVRRQRAKLARNAFSELQAAISNTPPEALARARQMLAELNRMVERRQAGADVQSEFEQFMDELRRPGPGSPGRPGRASGGVGTPAGRRPGAARFAQPGAKGQAGRAFRGAPRRRGGLAHGAREAPRPPGRRAEATTSWACRSASRPPARWSANYRTSSSWNNCWREHPSPGALAEVDIDRARQLLGEEDARSLEALGRLSRRLRESGLVEQKEGRMRLTPRGLRRIGDQALADLYTKLQRYRSGQHPIGTAGSGHERAGETKLYEWGDPFNLSIEQTVRNALARRRPGHARAALTGRLRDRAHRSAGAFGDSDNARPFPFHADEGAILSPPRK